MQKPCFPKNAIPHAWNCASLLSSQSLLPFSVHQDSLLDTTFSRYLYSHLCIFFQRSPREGCCSSKSIRLWPLNKPTPSNTNKKHESNAPCIRSYHSALIFINLINTYSGITELNTVSTEEPESNLVEKKKHINYWEFYTPLLCSL